MRPRSLVTALIAGGAVALGVAAAARLSARGKAASLPPPTHIELPGWAGDQSPAESEGAPEPAAPPVGAPD